MNLFLKLFRAAFLFAVAGGLSASGVAQILMSAGTYSQNFNSLATNGSNIGWTDNATLPGWFATKLPGAAGVIEYNASRGSDTSAAFYSFGSLASSERALGSLCSGSITVIAYGVCFTNDTAFAQTNITISFTGEEWRSANGAGAETNTLSFSYRVGRNITFYSSDANNVTNWTAVSALNFNSPYLGAGAALDGNAGTNRQIFSGIVLGGVVLQPGDGIFLRWRDVDNSGGDAGVAIDDLTVSFQPTAVAPPPMTNAPVITSQPLSQATGENGFAIFSATAAGSPSPLLQWQHDGTNLPGATSPTLALYNVTTGQAGYYSVRTTNSFGTTNSFSAALIVNPVSVAPSNGTLRFLTYNVNGNGATNDWSTNATQVQAIGRQLIYLNPDIVTFNEIVYTNTFQMANWMKAYLPGFFLATNSGTDGSIRSVIASRFPIMRSQSWLNNSSLAPFGYSGPGFTRDLFEAQIMVSNWPVPLHVFVAHLKATLFSNSQDDADKRAAQASAIANFFATIYLPGTNGLHPYILSGDLNEDVFFPDNNYVSGHPVQRLAAPPASFQLTTPVNPFRNSPSNAFTESIRNPLDVRFDYILPCALLFSNIAASEVFRTDLLTNFPSNLFSNDDKIASDHLPVLTLFNNPYARPFRFTSIVRTNSQFSLAWETLPGLVYQVEASSNLTVWTPWSTNLPATNSTITFETNVTSPEYFFRIKRQN